MAELPKKLSKAAAREVASQLFWSAWPYWGAPIVTGALAYAGGYPSAIIFLMALGAFAMIALALNNYAQWRERQSAAGKVDFLAPAVAINAPDGTLRGLKLGVALRSNALFPMEARIDELETQISNRVPSEPFYVRSVPISRGNAVQFTNAMINLADLERAGKILYGHISARISYGRPGNFRYSSERQWYLAIKFDKDGNFEGMEPSLTEFKTKD